MERMLSWWSVSDRARLPGETLTISAEEDKWGADLDRDVAVQRRMPATVHRRHPALADLLQDGSGYRARS